jgi:hypothetical protein
MGGPIGRPFFFEIWVNRRCPYRVSYIVHNRHPLKSFSVKDCPSGTMTCLLRRSSKERRGVVLGHDLAKAQYFLKCLFAPQIKQFRLKLFLLNLNIPKRLSLKYPPQFLIWVWFCIPEKKILEFLLNREYSVTYNFNSFSFFFTCVR